MTRAGAAGARNRCSKKRRCALGSRKRRRHRLPDGDDVPDEDHGAAVHQFRLPHGSDLRAPPGDVVQRNEGDSEEQRHQEGRQHPSPGREATRSEPRVHRAKGRPDEKKLNTS
jgi:hypothetical protein